MTRLDGKTALITGTSPNIGGGLAEALAAAGAAVIAVDARADNAMDCARALQDGGARALGIACDVRNEAEAAAAVAAGVAAFGRIDILINNAAIFNKKGVLDMPLAEWRDQVDIILTGAFVMTQAVTRALVEQGAKGAVLNIISTAGHQGEPGNIAYSTAKCGLLNFTRSAAMELVSHGIRVNSLTPTATDPSESFARAERWGRKVRHADEILEMMEPFRRGIPMQKLPTPTDYGRAAAFLVSDEAEMITGADLRVDAGAVARYWAWNPAGGGV
jgi:NAD(P)-dependent dehydrogenase (short-subunit alcohol dehydrogenase family)